MSTRVYGIKIDLCFEFLQLLNLGVFVLKVVIYIIWSVQNLTTSLAPSVIYDYDILQFFLNVGINTNQIQKHSLEMYIHRKQISFYLLLHLVKDLNSKSISFSFSTHFSLLLCTACF